MAEIRVAVAERSKLQQVGVVNIKNQIMKNVAKAVPLIFISNYIHTGWVLGHPSAKNESQVG